MAGFVSLDRDTCVDHKLGQMPVDRAGADPDQDPNIIDRLRPYAGNRPQVDDIGRLLEPPAVAASGYRRRMFCTRGTTTER